MTFEAANRPRFRLYNVGSSGVSCFYVDSYDCESRNTITYHINITFPDWVIVENIMQRNVIINRGAAEVYNHISRDDIFDYTLSGNVTFILLYRTLDPLFSTVLGLPW